MSHVRSAEQVAPTAATLVWELRSNQTRATVTCAIEEYESGLCLIRIVHAGGEVMSCWYPCRQDAMDRAAAIETELLATGWDR